MEVKTEYQSHARTKDLPWGTMCQSPTLELAKLCQETQLDTYLEYSGAPRRTEALVWRETQLGLRWEATYGNSEMYICVVQVPDPLRIRVARAVDVILRHGRLESPNHKAWVIDQVLQELLQTEYEATLRSRFDGSCWDAGVSPEPIDLRRRDDS